MVNDLEQKDNDQLWWMCNAYASASGKVNCEIDKWRSSECVSLKRQDRKPDSAGIMQDERYKV
jgi:hypothetical protein